MIDMIKLNIGCGNDIRTGYVNCDKVQLPGVDRIVNLDRELPFEDNSIDEIIAIDVLEHVRDVIKTLEELYRILKIGGRLIIRVPYWNSWCAFADPTHKRGFHEIFFAFYDPNSIWCKKRSYYSNARFEIISLNPVLYLFSPYYAFKQSEIKNKFMKRIVFVLSNYLSNITFNLMVVLEKK